MKIQIHHSEEHPKLSVYEIESLIKKRIEDCSQEDIKVNLIDEINVKKPYDGILPLMLKQHSNDVRYGEIGHSFGMGGTYGCGYTIYIDDKVLPQFMIDKTDGMVLVNTELWLETFTRCGRFEDIDFFEDSGCIGFEKLTGTSEKTRDNSYNYSSDLNRDIDYIIFSREEEWYHSDVCYLVVKIHQGGDVRGNYSDYRVYKLDSDDSYALIDGMHVGFDIVGDAENDEYSPRSTNEPQYHFYDDHDFIETDGTYIRAKNKETGKIVQVQPIHSINYR